MARLMMAIGSAAALVGTAIMFHGEMNFGDVILVGGLAALAVGTLMLARTPPGENNVD
ncbi:hypothetical protein N9D37_01200 [Erythrobacter sp.]|nr:hypothetical protein [Erythrobacter sp.]